MDWISCQKSLCAETFNLNNKTPCASQATRRYRRDPHNKTLNVETKHNNPTPQSLTHLPCHPIANQ